MKSDEAVAATIGEKVVRPIARVCLFCGANVGRRESYVEAARTLGALLAHEELTLVYGGGSVGLMNETASTALASGGRVIGVITEELNAREVGHTAITELHVVRTMHERKAMMASLADAFIGLPGGWGTLDEVNEMLTWNQLGIHAKPVVLVDVERYFEGFIRQADRAVEDGLLRPENRALLLVASTPLEALKLARQWQPPPAVRWSMEPVPQP